MLAPQLVYVLITGCQFHIINIHARNATKAVVINAKVETNLLPCKAAKVEAMLLPAVVVALVQERVLVARTVIKQNVLSVVVEASFGRGDGNA